MAERETAWLEDWVFREVRDWEPAKNFSRTKPSAHLGAVLLSMGKIRRDMEEWPALCFYSPQMNTRTPCPQPHCKPYVCFSMQRHSGCT